MGNKNLGVTWHNSKKTNSATVSFSYHSANLGVKPRQGGHQWALKYNATAFLPFSAWSAQIRLHDQAKKVTYCPSWHWDEMRHPALLRQRHTNVDVETKNVGNVQTCAEVFWSRIKVYEKHVNVNSQCHSHDSAWYWEVQFLNISQPFRQIQGEEVASAVFCSTHPFPSTSVVSVVSSARHQKLPWPFLAVSPVWSTSRFYLFFNVLHGMISM